MYTQYGYGGVWMEQEVICKSNVISRLKKIEGQVKGIQNMIEENKNCNDVMIQISAVRSAINKVGGLVLEAYIKEYVQDSLVNNKKDEIEGIIETIVKFTK